MIPENPSEQATISGNHKSPPASSTTTFSEIGHSGSPLIPQPNYYNDGLYGFNQRLLAQKHRRITGGAFSKLKDRLRNNHGNGTTLTLGQLWKQQVFGKHGYYEAETTSARARLLKPLAIRGKQKQQDEARRPLVRGVLLDARVELQIDLIPELERAERTVFDQYFKENRLLNVVQQKPKKNKPWSSKINVTLNRTAEDSKHLCLLERIQRLAYNKRTECWLAEHCTVNSDGFYELELKFTEKANGRLHCDTLDRVPKYLRNAIFKGFHQYDISSCAPTILVQLFHRYCPDVPTPLLDEFLTDPTKQRQELADFLRTDKDIPKKLINALFHGARVPSRAQIYTNQPNAIASTGWC